MPIEIELDEKLIKKILKDFQNCKPLQRSDIINRMAKRVAKQMTNRDKENIYEWAESLSKDISKLKD